MRRAFVAWGLALLVSAAGAQAPASADPNALRACMRRNLPQKTLAETIVITQTAADGSQRRLAGNWYWQNDNGRQSGMLRLTLPADMAGAAYLFLGNGSRQDYYLYLPSVNKVRHVTGATTAQSLFDTGVSAFDLKFLFSGLRGGRLSRIGPASDAARPSERWRYVPPVDPDILYDRVELTVDQQWCVMTQAALYGGVPWKTLTVAPNGVQQVDGRWVINRATLVDLRSGNSSLIELRDPKIDQALPDGVFSPSRFYREH